MICSTAQLLWLRNSAWDLGFATTLCPGECHVPKQKFQKIFGSAQSKNVSKVLASRSGYPPKKLWLLFVSWSISRWSTPVISGESDISWREVATSRGDARETQDFSRWSLKDLGLPIFFLEFASRNAPWIREEPLNVHKQGARWGHRHRLFNSKAWRSEVASLRGQGARRLHHLRRLAVRWPLWVITCVNRSGNAVHQGCTSTSMLVFLRMRLRFYLILFCDFRLDWYILMPTQNSENLIPVRSHSFRHAQGKVLNLDSSQMMQFVAVTRRLYGTPFSSCD